VPEIYEINVIIGLIFVFTTVFGLMLVAYDDGESFAIYKRIRCRLGYHSMYVKLGKIKRHRYYCRFCKKPREHPVLKVIDGGKKMVDNKFRF
jgi:hypothetical protein